MTLLSPDYHIDIDGTDLATYAHGLETVDGIDTVPGRRIRDTPGAYVDGVFPSLNTPSFHDKKIQRLRLWVSATDENGDVTFAKGPIAHLQKNVEDLKRLVGGAAISNVEVDWTVPTPTGNRILRNFARISSPMIASGSTRLIRRFPLTLEYPWPYFQDITAGQKTVGPFTGAQSFTPLGTAPLADATFICTAVGKIIHVQTGDFIEVTGLGGGTAVTITQRPPRTVIKTGGGGGDARDLYNSNNPWGLRFSAGVLANLTITGTWQIDYFDAEH